MNIRTLAMIAMVGPAILALSPATAKSPEPADFGPAPEFASAIAASEAVVRRTLTDPDSGKFEWPYGFVAGSSKGVFGKRMSGWWTCGYVNARNKMGGYAGRQFAYTMVKDGAVIGTDIGNDDGISVADVSCRAAVKSGTLPAAPAAPAFAQATAPTALPSGRLPVGIQFQPSPIGALIVTVVSGSIGDKAGLKPGMVITAVNGVPTKDFPSAQMITLVQAPTPTITYSILGAADVVIRR